MIGSVRGVLAHIDRPGYYARPCVCVKLRSRVGVACTHVRAAAGVGAAVVAAMRRSAPLRGVRVCVLFVLIFYRSLNQCSLAITLPRLRILRAQLRLFRTLMCASSSRRSACNTPR